MTSGERKMSRRNEILLQLGVVFLIMAIFGCGILFGMTLVPPEIIVIEKTAPADRGSPPKTIPCSYSKTQGLHVSEYNGG